MENIGKRIREFRKKQNLTQIRLAEYIGVTDQAVSKWERGTALPDIGLIGPLCKTLGVTADGLLGIETPKADHVKEFEERVESVFREKWTGNFPPTLDTKKVAEEFLERGISPENVSDETIESWIPWVKMTDEQGGKDSSRIGKPGEEDFRDLLRFRALAGDGDALDLLCTLGPYQLTGGRLLGYARAFSLCRMLGATEIVDIGCGDIPHLRTILDSPGLKYTGISSWADNERFNRLLHPYAPDVRYEKKQYPCEIQTGDGAMGLAFMFHVKAETADELMTALAKDFDRVIVQVWDSYEAAFLKAFAGFSVRILCRKEYYGRYTGTLRRRQTIFFATRIREDIRTLDELRYDWYDTRFLYCDDRFRREYHKKWDDATRKKGSFSSCSVDKWIENEILPSFGLSEEERAILEEQWKNRNSSVHFCVEPTADGYAEAVLYDDPTSLPRFSRNGSGDFTLAEGPCSYEGKPYYFAAMVRGGLLRTIEAMVVPEEGKPDRAFWYREEWVKTRERWAGIGKE